MLPDHRQDGARDDVPIVIERDRDNGLDVDKGLVAVVRAVTAVIVELERYADQRSDGVRDLLGQILTRFLGYRKTAETRGESQGDRTNAMKPGESHWDGLMSKNRLVGLDNIVESQSKASRRLTGQFGNSAQYALRATSSIVHVATGDPPSEYCVQLPVTVTEQAWRLSKTSPGHQPCRVALPVPKQSCGLPISAGEKEDAAGLAASVHCTIFRAEFGGMTSATRS